MPTRTAVKCGTIHPKIQEYVETVCRATGTPLPSRWVTMLEETPGMGVASFGDGYGFCAADSVVEYFSEPQIYGMIAHELGHVRNRDVWRGFTPDNLPSQEEMHEIEYKADLYAVEVGMGMELAESLVVIIVHIGDHQHSRTHPTLTSRINRIMEAVWEKKRQKKQSVAAAA